MIGIEGETVYRRHPGRLALAPRHPRVLDVKPQYTFPSDHFALLADVELII
jgi:hypothetical protein